MPSKTKKGAPTAASEASQPVDDDVSMPDADAEEAEGRSEELLPSLEGQRIRIVRPQCLSFFFFYLCASPKPASSSSFPAEEEEEDTDVHF
jgi:hypothetical protein